MINCNVRNDFKDGKFYLMSFVSDPGGTAGFTAAIFHTCLDHLRTEGKHGDD